MRMKRGRTVRVSGRGDYTLSAPVSSGGSGAGLIRGTSVPEFKSSKHGCEIIHREYITDIVSINGAFNTQMLTINAGNEQTFPWLSSVASNFQQYEFKGLMFEFKSNAADALTSANVSLGSVLMAVQYDAENLAAPESKSEFLNLQGSTSGRPSCNQVMGVECYRPENPLGVYFVSADSAAAASAGRDSRFEDVGNLITGTQGIPGNSVVGELWVSYHVCLLKPRLGGGAVGADIEVSRYNSTVLQHANPGGDGVDIFGLNNGNSMVPASGCTFPMQFLRGVLGDAVNMTIIQFPNTLQGYFLVDIQWLGPNTSLQSWDNSYIGATGIVGVNIFPAGNGGATDYSCVSTVMDDTDSSWQLFCYIDGPSAAGTKYGPCLQFKEAGLDPGTLTTPMVMVSQVNQSIGSGKGRQVFPQYLVTP